VTAYLQEHGLPLVGIVNNAGISGRVPVEAAPLGEIKSLFNTNYFGTVDLTQAFLPLIRKDKGRIVFISSVAGLTGTYGGAFYGGTKRAMEGLADSMRLEMNPFGVSVSSVLPGYIKTSIENKVRTHEDLNVPKEKYLLYQNFFDNMLHRRKQVFKNAYGPEVTSEAVLQALTDPYPKTRYYVGDDGEFFSAQALSILLGILPDRLVDKLKEKH